MGKPYWHNPHNCSQKGYALLQVKINPLESFSQSCSEPTIELVKLMTKIIQVTHRLRRGLDSKNFLDFFSTDVIVLAGLQKQECSRTFDRVRDGIGPWNP